MQQPGDSAVGWYTEKYQAALDIAAGEFPELVDDNAFAGSTLPGLALVKNKENARSLMTAVMGMFGAGPIEMLAREMTAELLAIRDKARIEADLSNQPVIMSLNAKGVNFGSITVHPDGTVDSSAVLGVDHDMGDITGCIGALVGNKLEVVEPIELAVKVPADDPCHRDAVDLVAPCVGGAELDLQLAAFFMAKLER